MAIENKYRVHEVAKDFGVSTKAVSYTHLRAKHGHGRF